MNSLSNFNSLLAKFIQSITRTVRERHHPKLQPESGTAKHTKSVRQYFILSLLLCCVNPNQPHLLHNILADVVEVSGGSHLLLQVLNRLGCFLRRHS